MKTAAYETAAFILTIRHQTIFPQENIFLIKSYLFSLTCQQGTRYKPYYDLIKRDRKKSSFSSSSSPFNVT